MNTLFYTSKLVITVLLLSACQKEPLKETPTRNNLPDVNQQTKVVNTQINHKIIAVNKKNSHNKDI